MSVEIFQIEIRVRNLPGAVAFYRSIAEWGIYQSAPNYALVDTGRMPVVGLLREPRLPLGVCPMAIVSDCEAMVLKAKELGGKVIITKSLVGETGAFTGSLDPWGNELFFWQPFIEGRPSLKNPPVNPFVFFEISAPSLAKAKAYYKELLGWEFWDVTHTPNYAVMDGGGLKRGIGLVGGDAAASGTICYIEVPSVEETAKQIVANGGQVVVPPTSFLDAGRYIVFSDPDGNRLGAVELR